MASAIEYGLLATFTAVAVIAGVGLVMPGSDPAKADSVLEAPDSEKSVVFVDGGLSLARSNTSGLWIMECPAGTILVPDISSGQYTRTGVCAPSPP